MAKQTAIGLKSILMGDVGADGGMGTTLTELVGDTVRGTAVLNSTPIESTDIMTEESDDPLLSITTGGGVFTFVWSSYNIDPTVLKKAFGGAINATTGVWEAPDKLPDIYQSIKAETRNGVIVQAVNVKITAELSLNMQVDSPGQINFTGKVLKATKESTPKITIGIPTGT